MSVYANGLLIQMNEIALLQFTMNNQNGQTPVVTVAIMYDVLKQMHEAIGNCIKQHDTNLHQLKRDQAKAN